MYCHYNNNLFQTFNKSISSNTLNIFNENDSLKHAFKECAKVLRKDPHLMDKAYLMKFENKMKTIHQEFVSKPANWGPFPSVSAVYRHLHPDWEQSIDRHFYELRTCIHAKLNQQSAGKKIPKLNKHLHIVKLLNEGDSSREFMESLFNKDVTSRLREFDKEINNKGADIHKMCLWLKINHYLHPENRNNCTKQFLRLIEKELGIKLKGDLLGGFSMEVVINNSMNDLYPKIKTLVNDPLINIKRLSIKQGPAHFSEADNHYLRALIDPLMPNLKELDLGHLKISRPVILLQELKTRYPSLDVKWTS